MDGLAARSLLLGSLVLGAAICIGSIATAQYLASTRIVAHGQASRRKAARRCVVPQPPVSTMS